jgi:hypothetical protein
MPFTFNGIGTTIYGARDFKPDGSYIATEWLVFVYVPVIPYRSMRILPNGKTTNAVVYRSSGYQMASTSFRCCRSTHFLRFSLGPCGLE